MLLTKGSMFDKIESNEIEGHILFQSSKETVENIGQCF
jgi:hypothetical protein